MMSRKTWMKALTALEMLPLVAAATLATTYVAKADGAAAPSPSPSVSASPSPSPSTSPSPSPSPSSSASPSPSPRASHVPASYIRDGEYDLKLSEAKEAVRGLRLEVTHADRNDPSSPIISASLHGKMYNECVDDFEIRSTTMPTSNGSFGFSVVDKTGKGFDCVKKQNSRKCTTNSCTPLTAEKFGDSTILDLSSANAKDGNIQLLHTDQDTDAEPVGEDIGDSIKFESSTTLKKRAQDEADRLKKERTERNKEAFKNCLSNENDLKVATRALNELIRDGGIAAEDIKSMRSDLTKAKEEAKKKKVAAEFKSLQKRIAKLKDMGDVEELSQAIADFAEDHPDDEDGKNGYGKAAQRAQLDLINKVQQIGNGSPESFDAQRQVYQTLMGMDAPSAADVKSYRVAMTGLDIQQQAAAFQSGNFGWSEYSSFMSSYNSGLLKEARADYMSSCANNKANAMANACMQAMKNFQAAQMMPSAAMSAMQQSYNQQLQEQRQQMQMQYQMQSQLNQYMSGVMGQGVQGAQMPTFMGAGTGFNANMGMNTNAGWNTNSGWGGNAGAPTMAGMNNGNMMAPQQRMY